MKQKSSNFGANGLKISKNASNNAVLGSKKGLIRYFLCIKPMLSIWWPQPESNRHELTFGRF